MVPNEQNQYFAELRQKVCLYTHAVVLQRGLPSLWTATPSVLFQENGKSCPPSLSQTDYSGMEISRVTLRVFSRYGLIYPAGSPGADYGITFMDRHF